jgi:lysophospholipase L1-like esterase
MMNTEAAKTFSRVVLAKDTVKIKLLGDSITHAAKYTSYLQMALAEQYPDNPPTVVNCGINGDHASSVLGAGRVDWDVLPNRPDRVFVMLGMNDVLRDKWKSCEPECKENAEARLHALRFYEQKLRQLAVRLKKEVGSVVLMTPSPYDQYGMFDGNALLGCNEPGLARCAEIVRKIGSELALPVVDLYHPMTEILKRGTYERLCGNDRVHPGETGHSLIAALILRACRKDFGDAEDIARQLRENACAPLAMRYAAAVSDIRRLAEYRKAVRMMGGDVDDEKEADRLLDKWVEKAYALGWGDGAKSSAAFYRVLRGQASKLDAKAAALRNELLERCKCKGTKR